MKTNLRNSDIVCRYGGEEFYIILLLKNQGNSIIQSILAKRDDVKEKILNLFDYTKYHLHYEEKLMHKINVSQYESHKKLHGALLNEVLSLLNKVKDNS